MIKDVRNVLSLAVGFQPGASLGILNGSRSSLSILTWLLKLTEYLLMVGLER